MEYQEFIESKKHLIIESNIKRKSKSYKFKDAIKPVPLTGINQLIKQKKHGQQLKLF